MNQQDDLKEVEEALLYFLNMKRGIVIEKGTEEAEKYENNIAVAACAARELNMYLDRYGRGLEIIIVGLELPQSVFHKSFPNSPGSSQNSVLLMEELLGECGMYLTDSDDIQQTIRVLAAYIPILKHEQIEDSRHHNIIKNFFKMQLI